MEDTEDELQSLACIYADDAARNVLRSAHGPAHACALVQRGPGHPTLAIRVRPSSRASDSRCAWRAACAPTACALVVITLTFALPPTYPAAPPGIAVGPLHGLSMSYRDVLRDRLEKQVGAGARARQRGTSRG